MQTIIFCLVIPNDPFFLIHHIYFRFFYLVCNKSLRLIYKELKGSVEKRDKSHFGTFEKMSVKVGKYIIVHISVLQQRSKYLLQLALYVVSI